MKTDTDDSSGTTRKASTYIPRKNEILEALKYYSEVPFQVPPRVSAEDKKGKRAYERFKAKENFQLTARRIKVYTLSLQSYDKKGETLVHFECSKGGYVRSIARDIGDFLGCFGHVRNLKRIEYGPFKADKATDLSYLLDLSIENLISNIIDIEIGIPGLKIFECNSDDVGYLENGRPIKCPLRLILEKAKNSLQSIKEKSQASSLEKKAFLKVKRKFNT